MPSCQAVVYGTRLGKHINDGFLPLFGIGTLAHSVPDICWIYNQLESIDWFYWPWGNSSERQRQLFSKSIGNSLTQCVNKFYITLTPSPIHPQDSLKQTRASLESNDFMVSSKSIACPYTWSTFISEARGSVCIWEAGVLQSLRDHSQDFYTCNFEY